MIIVTERLRLRPFRPEDGEALYAYLSDAETVYYEPYTPYSMDAAREEAVNRSQDPSFIAVCLKETDLLIGNLYLSKCEFDSWELGYVFHPAYHGRGYATEAASAALRWTFLQAGARRVEAHCALQNEPSWKLMERLGMRREGLHLQSVYFKTDEKGAPIWWDSCDYALLRDEWLAAHAADPAETLTDCPV